LILFQCPKEIKILDWPIAVKQTFTWAVPTFYVDKKYLTEVLSKFEIPVTCFSINSQANREFFI